MDYDGIFPDPNDPGHFDPLHNDPLDPLHQDPYHLNDPLHSDPSDPLHDAFHPHEDPYSPTHSDPLHTDPSDPFHNPYTTHEDSPSTHGEHAHDGIFTDTHHDGTHEHRAHEPHQSAPHTDSHGPHGETPHPTIPHEGEEKVILERLKDLVSPNKKEGHAEAHEEVEEEFEEHEVSSHKPAEAKRQKAPITPLASDKIIFAEAAQAHVPTSLYRKHLHGETLIITSLEDAAKIQLAQTVYEKALATNGEIKSLVSQLREAEYNRQRMQSLYSHELKDLEKAGVYVRQQIASGDTKLLKAQQNVDRAFTVFEEKFFATEEGKKFKSFIEAAAKGDYAEFLKGHPDLVKRYESITEEAVKNASKIAAERGVTDVAEHVAPNAGKVAAEETTKAAETWVKRVWSHPAGKWGTISAGVAAVAGLGYWALKEKKPEGNQAQQNAAPQR